MKTQECSECKCWYCFEQDENLVFSVEFDTYLHLSCLRIALHDQNDEEAKIFAREFNINA